MRAPAALLLLAVVARPGAAQPCAAPDQTRGFRPGPCDCLCESGSHIDVTRALGDGTCGSLGGAWDFASHGLDGHGSCEAHRSELESHLQSGLGLPLAQVQQACCVPRPAADDPLDADSWCAAVPRGACDVEALVGELRTLMTEAGGRFEDICKVKVWVTDRAFIEPVHRVLAERLRGIHVVMNTVCINGLARPYMNMEIDVYAVIQDD